VFVVITTALHLTRRNEVHRECARIALRRAGERG
jgi:hypothetical protein